MMMSKQSKAKALVMNEAQCFFPHLIGLVWFESFHFFCFCVVLKY